MKGIYTGSLYEILWFIYEYTVDVEKIKNVFDI